MSIQILNVGGSIISPGGLSAIFIEELLATLKTWLKLEKDRQLIIVIGGGDIARNYQNTYKKLADMPSNDATDWIGIAATRLNSELMYQLVGEWCKEPIVTNPDKAPGNITGRFLLATGWKPGFSTDYIAVLLAQKYKLDQIIKLSNIEKVYTADPKKDSCAKPLDYLSWDRYAKMSNDIWIPGNNVPFDPVATKHAAQAGIRAIISSGKNLRNLLNILDGLPFIGTTLGCNENKNENGDKNET